MMSDRVGVEGFGLSLEFERGVKILLRQRPQRKVLRVSKHACHQCQAEQYRQFHRCVLMNLTLRWVLRIACMRVYSACIIRGESNGGIERRY